MKKLTGTLLIGLGLAAGYFVSAPTSAQSLALPIGVGERVILWYDYQQPCTVAAVRGSFVLCRTEDKNEQWWNLATATSIVKGRQ
jgi:hypothetical protein